MALTGTETFGTVVPGFVTDSSGNLVLTTEPAAEVFGTVVPGFLTDADGRLVATYTPAAEVRTKIPGFVTDADGRLAIATEVASPVYTQVPGFLTDSSGYLSVQETPTSGVFVTGFIRDTDGALGVGATYVASPYEAAVMDLTPSIFLPLTKTAGLTDLSGNSRNGTAAGGITAGGYTPGPLATGDNGATDFDGSDDRITTTYQPYVNAAARTFMGWAYRDTSTTSDAMVGGSGTDPPVVAILGSSQTPFFEAAISGANGSWTSTWPGNEVWVHWALTFDESTNAIAFYVNGVSVTGTSSLATQYGNAAAAGNFQIGSYTSTTMSFDGKQAWVSVHERALTAGEILAAYTAGIT